MHNDITDFLFSKFSRLSTIINILAYCMKFISLCKMHVLKEVDNESKYNLRRGNSDTGFSFIPMLTYGGNFALRLLIT